MLSNDSSTVRSDGMGTKGLVDGVVGGVSPVKKKVLGRIRLMIDTLTRTGSELSFDTGDFFN